MQVQDATMVHVYSLTDVRMLQLVTSIQLLDVMMGLVLTLDVMMLQLVTSIQMLDVMMGLVLMKWMHWVSAMEIVSVITTATVSVMMMISWDVLTQVLIIMT